MLVIPAHTTPRHCEERSDGGVPGMGIGLEVKVLRGASW